MKKIFFALVGLVLVGAVAFYLMRANDIPESMSETQQEQEVPLDASPEEDVQNAEVRGTVSAINGDQMAFDGPGLITLQKEDGTEAVIAVPSMGINLCAARANMTDFATFTIGDVVEVRGAVETDGTLTPCASSDHYLRVVAE